jgi:hypothetical protein
MNSGVPSSVRIRAASRVRYGDYDEILAHGALPKPQASALQERPGSTRHCQFKPLRNSH